MLIMVVINLKTLPLAWHVRVPGVSCFVLDLIGTHQEPVGGDFAESKSISFSTMYPYNYVVQNELISFVVPASLPFCQ
jgi:hypothetical protein